MQKITWILPLLCLVATPINASIVGIDFSGNSDLVRQDTDKPDPQTRRDSRSQRFNGTFEIGQPGSWQVKFEDLEHDTPPSWLDIEFTRGKDHIVDYIRNDEGFIVEAPPGKYGFSIIARHHNKTHADDFSVEVIPPTTSAVPLPASAWLFGSGLIGLIAAVRRKVA